MQHHLADQLEWVNVTPYSFFQAYRQSGQNVPFSHQAYLFFDMTWLDP